MLSYAEDCDIGGKGFFGEITEDESDVDDFGIVKEYGLVYTVAHGNSIESVRLERLYDQYDVVHKILQLLIEGQVELNTVRDIVDDLLAYPNEL